MWSMERESRRLLEAHYGFAKGGLFVLFVVAGLIASGGVGVLPGLLIVGASAFAFLWALTVILRGVFPQAYRGDD
jgi:hypothetical protein